MRGKTDTGKYAIFDENDVLVFGGSRIEKIEEGDYVMGLVESVAPRTLFCKPMIKCSIE